MNGLLTALLGGTAGVGQGLQLQDDRDMRRNQQRMERLNLAADLLSKGITPPDELTADFQSTPPRASMPNTNVAPAAPASPSAPMITAATPSRAPMPPSAPRGLLTSVMKPDDEADQRALPFQPTTVGNVSGRFTSMPSRADDTATPSTNAQAPTRASIAPSLTGGVSGTDAMRSAFPSLSLGAATRVGGLEYNPLNSLPVRQMMIGVQGDALKKEQEYAIDQRKVQDKADALVMAGARNPDGTPMSRDEALSVALNGDNAFQRAPVFGTKAYNDAKVSEQGATAPGRIAEQVETEKRVAPIRIATTVQTARELAPIHVAESKATALANESSPKYIAEQTNKILDDYRTDAAEWKKALSGYEVLKGAMEHPGIATPFAVLDAYARVINPGAVVRQGTMQVLQEMGSYDDKVRRWLAMAQQGQWPPEMIDSIKGTIDGIMAQHYQSYLDGARNRAVLRGRGAGVDITPYLDPDHPEFANTKRYSPNNPWGKP